VFSDEIARSYAATNPNAMASFTSWGPAPNMAFKPTISAPGVAIFSSVPGNQYATYQGTSMAAPHVAGAVAVIKQAHPDWTPEQIKQALVNTAEPISKYSPRVQGAGRINVAKAVKNNVFITYNNQPYGELGAFTGNKTITLTVTNKGSTTYTANITGYVTTSLEQIVYGNQGATYTVGSVSTPASVTVDPGTTKTIQVTVQPSDAWTDIFVEGRVLFTSSDGTRVFPFLGYFGNWALYSDKDTINGDSKWPDNNNIIDLPWWNADSWEGLTGVYYPYGGRLYNIGRKGGQFEPKALAISAGSDYSTWNDSLVVGLGMLRNARALTIYVLDSAGKVVKTIVSENFVRAAVNSGDSTTAGLRTGWSKLWEWDGTDRNGNFVPEGQYTIRIVAMPDPLISDETNLLPTQVMDIPVKVDRTLPEVNLTKMVNIITSTIAYIDLYGNAIGDATLFTPTASTFSFAFTATDASTVSQFCLFKCMSPTSDEFTFTYNILELVQDVVGSTDESDGSFFGTMIYVADGAGNATTATVVYIVYDNPNTPVELRGLNAVVEGESMKVSFDVVNAPGATYEVNVRDSSGKLIASTTGVATHRPLQSIELKFELPSVSETYTVEVQAYDIYGNRAYVTSGSSTDLSVTIMPEGDGNFIVVKQGVSTPLTVKIVGPVETATLTLSKSVVEDGVLTTKVIKQVTFTGATFTDPHFLDEDLQAGRYQITVEAKSVLGKTFVLTRRLVVDGDVPKLVNVGVMSDDAEILVEKHITDGVIDLVVRTEENTTGQIVLMASDESSAFVVYLDGEELGSWGDPGAGGEGTFFVPIAINLGLDEMHTVKVVDEAGHSAEYFFRLRVTNMAGDLPPVVGSVKLTVGDLVVVPYNSGTFTVTVPSTPVDAVLTFDASDDNAVDHVVVTVNGVEVSNSSPANIRLVDGENVIAITAVDSIGQDDSFSFTVNVVEEGSIGAGFDFNFGLGTAYFGFPIYVNKTISDIFPGVDVYRKSDYGWVLANSEKPMPFATYQATFTEGTYVHLVGDKFKPSTITLLPIVSNYVTIPQLKPVNAYDLFGTALIYVKEVTNTGGVVNVTDGMMLPGRVYVVVLSRPVTITLP